MNQPTNQSEDKSQSESEPSKAPPPGQDNTGENGHAAQQGADIEPVAEQIGKMLQHPMVNRYLGKATKVVAVCAILGCALLVIAITAVTNLFNQILSSIGSH